MIKKLWQRWTTPQEHDGPVLLANPGYLPPPAWTSRLSPDELFSPERLAPALRKLEVDGLGL